MKQISRRDANRILEVLFELVGLVIAWHGTIQLRLFLNLYMSTQFGRAELDRHAPPLSALIGLWLVAQGWLATRPPSQKRGFRFGDSLLGVAESGVLASTLVIVVSFFCVQFGLMISRAFVLLFMPVSFASLLLSRCMQYWLVIVVEARWPSPERVAILGQGPEAQQILDRFRSTANGDMTVTGIILPENGQSEPVGVPVLGTTRRLAEVINQTRLDRIVSVRGCLSDQEEDECEVISHRMGVVFSQALAPAGMAMPVHFAFADVCGLPLIEMRPVAFTRRQETLKRLFDLVMAGATLVLLAPLLLLIGMLIALTSEGPVLYKSWRVGKGGRYFTFLKFRTMYQSAGDRQHLAARNEKDGHIFKMRKDPRVTPVGTFLRRYSLDELPQLLNVLRGDMSLIGPRPLPAQDLDPDGQSRQFRAWSEQRSRVLPGITGLWQIRGRSDLSFEEMMTLDVEYIRNWSLGLDFRILAETPVVVLTGRGAY